MIVQFRSPFKVYPSITRKSGAVPYTITTQQMKFWGETTSKIFDNIFGNVSRLNLQTVEGQTRAFMECAPVAAMVGRLAEYSMNGRYAFVDDKGKELTTVNNNLYKIMQRPNFFQTWEEFIAGCMTFIKAHGQCYVFPIIPAGFESGGIKNAKSLLVIPNYFVTPMYTGRSVYQTDMSGVVSEYRVSFLDNPIPASQMIVIRDSSPAVTMDVTKLFEGQSRLYSLGDQINNLIANQDAQYNSIVKRGAFGFVVPDSPDGMGAKMPFDDKEEEEVLASFLKYGPNSNHRAPFAILKQAVKFVPTNMGISDLRLLEGMEAGIAQISMSLNVPMFLLGFKDSTFTNLEAAGKSCYTSGVIPAVNNILSNLSTAFQCTGFSLKSFWDHLEIFQKSKKDEAEALKMMTGALDSPYKSGLLGKKECRIMIATFIPVGVPFNPDEDPTDLYTGPQSPTLNIQP